MYEQQSCRTGQKIAFTKYEGFSYAWNRPNY